MGLRDRGFVLDFYIPLFSGVEAARRASGRLRFPSGGYNPYIGDGGGADGSIGGGDGGFYTPIDNTISTPSITYPNLGDHTGVCPDDTTTASAFNSSNGQTHVASRWWIEAVTPGGSTGTGSFIYDSGAESAHLTSLPMSVVSLAPSTSYRVFVRYKGSNGGWSDFSLHALFTTDACGVCGASLATFVQTVVLSFDPNALTSHSLSISAPTEVSMWLQRKVYVRAAGWDDYGNILGNTATVTGALNPGHTALYSGADVLISDEATSSFLPLTGTVTNVAAGGCSFSATLVWTGLPPA